MNDNDVLLPPIGSNIYRSIVAEPQYVQIRQTNRGFVYLDSQASTLEINKVQMNLSTIQRNGESPNPLSNSICRIVPSACGIFYCTPNVNQRNNTIRFYSTAVGGFNTVTIPEGYYLTPTELMTQIVTEMNTVSGSSGLTFTFSDAIGTHPTVPTMFSLNATGGLFYFDQNCDAVKYGAQLYNFPVSNTPVTASLVGNMGMFYTRYIDVTSDRLNQYTKNQSLSNNKTINILFRLFIDDPTAPPHWISGAINQPSGYAFEPSDQLTNIPFILKDQFGDNLYVPPGPLGTNAGFIWDLNIVTEI